MLPERDIRSGIPWSTSPWSAWDSGLRKRNDSGSMGAGDRCSPVPPSVPYVPASTMVLLAASSRPNDAGDIRKPSPSMQDTGVAPLLLRVELASGLR